MRNEHMDPVRRFLAHLAMFEEGLVPYEVFYSDINRSLSSVSPEDARKMRRKFRKIWRKLLAADRATRKWPEKTKQKYGVGMNPSKKQKRIRKSLVWVHFYSRMIDPLAQILSPELNK